MYYLSADMCKLIVNMVAYPWDCLTMYDPNIMCNSIRKMFDDIGPNMFFDVVSHPVIVHEGLVHRAFITVMSKKPRLVLGVVDRVVLKDMVLMLYFTDAFGDEYAINSMSFRTYGTEGLYMDSENMVM